MKRLKTKHQYLSAKRRLDSLVAGKVKASAESVTDKEMQTAVIAGMQSLIDELRALIEEYDLHEKEKESKENQENEEKHSS